MEKKYPNADPRPRRRRDKDNPYKITTSGMGTPQTRYHVEFTDGSGARQCLEISREVFDALDGFELDDLSFMNEWDRHYEQSEQTEASINKRALRRPEAVDEIILKLAERDALRSAIQSLPETQRRRLVLYYYREMTYERIAEREGCTKMAVKFSVDRAVDRLKKYFENF